LTTTTLADFVQPTGGTANPSTIVSLRTLFHLVSIKSFTTFGSGTGHFHVPPVTSGTATMSLIDGDTSSSLWSSSTGGANFWSGWVQPSAGHAKLNFTTNGWPSCAVGTDPPDFSLCTGTGTFADDLTGVIPEAYEYRRYQSGGAPFWTPLRFPGQYFDPETDLSQNWNRFYDGTVGSFLEVEPALEHPPEVLWFAKAGGIGLPSYQYAENNPILYYDQRGLSPGRGLVPCVGYCGATICINVCLPGTDRPPDPMAPEDPEEPDECAAPFPPRPDPPPTIPIINPPERPPPKGPGAPGGGCKAVFDLMVGFCQSRQSTYAKVACIAVAAAIYLACMTRPH
jgi:RHS repeat-associated protein